MRRLTLIVIVGLTISANGFALEDTHENRILQAERYSKVMPISDMFKNVAEQAAMNLPPYARAEFKALLTKHLDLDALTQSVNTLLVKHFTADELKALADFYGSSVGKSAMKKFGAYMADAMPIIEAEMLKAQAKANRELQDKTQ